MSPEDLRLECLKLAHTHGREAQHVIERAKEYQAYVAGNDKPNEDAARPKLGLSQQPKPGTPGRK